MKALINFFKNLFQAPVGQIAEAPYKVEAPEKPKRVRKPRVAIKEPAKPAKKKAK